MIKAIKVSASDDYSISVELEDGKTIRMDMSFVKTQTGPVVEPLKQVDEFKKAFVRNGIVTWPTGYDVDPYYLLENGIVTNKSA